MEISQHIEPFKRDIEHQQGMAPGTVRNYMFYLGKFLSLMQIKDTDQITVDAIEKFKAHLDEQKISKKTVNSYLFCIRVFLKFLWSKDIPVLDARKVQTYSRLKQNPIDLIDHKELVKFLTATVNPMSDLLVNLIFASGMRIFEVAKLNIEDIHQCKVPIRGKGKKDRVAFLSSEVCKMLNAYTKGRTGPIFLNRSGNRMSIRYLQKLVEMRAAKLKVSKHLSVHTLRHHFATDMLENGADIRQIQEFLGHASIVTTQRYTHVSQKHLEDTYEKFHSKIKPVKIK